MGHEALKRGHFYRFSQSFQRKISVLYDPYNPGGCAVAGSIWNDIFFGGTLGLVFSGMAIFVIVAFLINP